MEIKKKNFFTLTFFIIGFIILLPICIVFLQTLKISKQDLILFLNSNFIDYSKQTFLLVILTALYSLILAVVPAFILSFFKIKYKNIFDVFLTLPLAIPCYIIAFTYSDIIGFNGYLYNLFNYWFNFQYDVLNIYWLSLFLSFSLYPYIYITSRISFSLIGSTYLNLSQNLSLSKFKIIHKIIIPLSFSGIFSGLILVVMEILNEYGAVKYFGIETFSVGIFKYWFSLSNKSVAIFLSATLLILVLLLLYFSSFLSKRDEKIRYHIKSNIKSSHLFSHSNNNFILYFIISLPIFFGFLLPVIHITNNVIKYINNYNFNDLLQLVGNSLYVSFISSLFIVIISFYLLNVKREFKNKYVTNILKLLTTGYAIPGAVIGLSLMLFIRFFDTNLTFLMGSIFLLIYAYIFRFMSVAIYPIQSSMEKQPIIFDKQSKSLKSSYLKTFTNITLPLNKKALFSAFILVFIDIVKELPITLILRPFNFETLATQTYIYASEENLGLSSLFSLTIIICCSILLVYVTSILNKKNVSKSK